MKAQKRFSGFEDLLKTQSKNHYSHTAVIYDEDFKVACSYGELYDRVLFRSSQLKSSGKTCIGILADFSFACIVEIFAANLAGMQIVMLDRTMPAPVLKELITYTDADMLFGNRKQAAELEDALTDGVKDGKGKILFFTSGTTERAKAVVLTDRSLMSSAYNGSCMLPLKTGDILLSILPLCHVFGFVCGLLWGLSCGASVALSRGPRHYTDDCTYFKPTAISVVPMLLKFLLQYNLMNDELDLILVGAGDCAKEILNAVNATGRRISYGYGLTETSSGVAISVSGDPSAMEVCPDDEIMLADDDEILVRAPECMMLGYYKLPEDTEAVLQDGILFTGDIGQFDADGRLHIIGRKKEILVLSDGTKIFLPEYIREISNRLHTQEIAVILRKDRPYIVVNDERSSEELMDLLGDWIPTLHRDHQPAGIIKYGKDLPRTSTGKIKTWEIAKETENL